MKRLVGTWLLEEFSVQFSDSRPDVHPFGSHPNGMLTYTPDGYMQAILSHEHRTPLSTTSFEKSHRASQQEKAIAFDEYLSYGGRYQVLEDHVIHFVEYALHPNVIGQKLIRYFSWLPDDRILLFYTVETSTTVRTHRLQWKRAKGTE